jgi:hypothetical protein
VVTESTGLELVCVELVVFATVGGWEALQYCVNTAIVVSPQPAGTRVKIDRLWVPPAHALQSL